MGAWEVTLTKGSALARIGAGCGSALVKTAIATTHRVAHGNERPGMVRCEARQNEFHTVNVTALDA